MADMRRFALIDLFLLFLVLVIAAGTRVGYLYQFADKANNSGPMRVQDTQSLPPGASIPNGMPSDPSPSELDVLIHYVQNDLWFGASAPFAGKEEETAHVSPGYPWLVGLLGKYVPTEQRDSLVRWIQAGLGSLTACFYFLFARRAFRSLAVGFLAGLLTALHPFWIINVAAINDGTLAGFALGGCLMLSGQAGENGGAFRSLLLGLALGGMALVRASMLPFAFVILVWYLLRSRTLSLGWLCAICAFLGFVISLAPWTVRNYQLYNEPVPVVSSTWYHLWIGNNERATGGPITPEMWQLTVQHEVPGQPGEVTVAKQLEAIPSQPVRYARLGKEIIAEFKRDPFSTARRRLLSTQCFLFGKQWLDNGNLFATQHSDDENIETIYDITAQVLQFTLLGMLFLAFLGWRWSYGWRWESIPAALAVMWVSLPYILGHAETLVGPRLPLDGVLLTYSAFTLCCLLPGIGTHLLDAPGAGVANRKSK